MLYRTLLIISVCVAINFVVTAWLLLRPAPEQLTGIMPITAAEPTFGATITTIQGSDTLSGSRSTINTNFANLNTAIDTAQAAAIASAFPFSTATSFSTATQGTTTPMWWRGNGTWGMFASSTSVFDYASSTALTISGALRTGTFYQTVAATSTFTGGVSMTAFGTTATSSGTNGINISDGCFAKNGACVGASGATIGAITASTTVGIEQHGLVVPASSVLMITANGDIDMDNTGTNATLQLLMSGQVVQTIRALRNNGNAVPFSFTYSTTTATTTNITVVTDLANLDLVYITSLIMPQQPLIN